MTVQKRWFGALLSVIGLLGLMGLTVVVVKALCIISRPNVILITVDALRADHLGVYGYRRPTSPHLDQFARDAIVFRHAYSHASATGPALGSLMTSHYPHETQLLWNEKHTLQAGVVTLAEILRARGYRTAAFVSNFTLRRSSGFEQGFDVYDDRMEDSSTSAGGVQRIAPHVTQAAVNWLNDHYRERFFLWVHYMDPHGPYAPPPPYNTVFVQPPSKDMVLLPVHQTNSGRGGIPAYQQLGDHRDPDYYIAQYDGEIRFFDESFGTLLESISTLGLLQHSLIIVTADHGESLGEHHYYFTHPDFLYDGLLHVPLIVRFPGPCSPAKPIKYPVTHVDILPTILERVSIKTAQPLRGVNLLKPKAREIFAETPVGGQKYALEWEGWKLILQQPSSRFYDVHKNHSEQADLMGGNGMDEALAAHVAELQARLDAIRRLDALHLGHPLPLSADEEVGTQFRALGYLQ